MEKAFLALAEHTEAKVKFYSRNNFGALAKLCEFSRAYSNENDFLKNLTKGHEKTNQELNNLFSALMPDPSTFDFLSRTSFELSPDFDRMKDLLRERLRQIASNSNAAFNALWTCLDKLGGRMEGDNLSDAARHRLTKDNLKDILHQSGAMLAPAMSSVEVRSSFAGTSAIGRSWVRDIADQRIPSPVVDELIAAIDAKESAVLLTGLPGSGKTCVMLSLQEELEQRAKVTTSLVPLFIQSREFADFETVQERQAQGLPEQWVAQAARLAEESHVVVVIDSLDVLSIAREHSILTYFLAQIDQLLLIPNVTVVTACRNFDRKYDRRIAVRQWDVEIECPPLDWDSEIAPLLKCLEIDSSGIDAVTSELIRNPRELSLFVELAQREGCFNVVTSQALAQRYLDTIIQDDPALGDVAMQAIEALAGEMLKERSLSIPLQRFNASKAILRHLKSLNVLQDTHDGKLTFGHQTLIDVLVISGTLRRSVSLNEFIQGLPPVPFVRPSIRSFVAQLATGDRREFRRQIRAVLTGDAAFHIRRLVAESIAQQIPQDDDWPLMRDLHNNHRDVFQVIYTQASSLEWHYFWISHLVPTLKDMCDGEGLKAHVRRVTQWKNEDAAGVLAFWMDMLALDWLDSDMIAEQLVYSLSEFKTENLQLVAPLLERLVNMPKPEHHLLGGTVARCVASGFVGDEVLWNYIAGDISDEDVIKLHFDSKLHCRPHEFGDKNKDFLAQRMTQSTTLLDLALDTVEKWSQTAASRYGETRIGYRYGYLANTSYIDSHSKDDDGLIDNERILLDSLESAILEHAKKNSDWWQKNRERLCFNHEGALCYFAILAFTKFPHSNINLIGRLLCDRDLLEFELAYEIGTLIEATFICLPPHTQDKIQEIIQLLWDELATQEENRLWILRHQAEYIAPIPCHLRSVAAQAILDTYEKKYGTLFRLPHIKMSGGWVAAPFPYEVFLNASDEGVVRLLVHYTGYKRDFDDFLIGGAREVGVQLREASSRHPLRFLKLLTAHWTGISTKFRDDIMDGAANYLAHRYGNLQANGNWVPIDEPDATDMARKILDELDRHPGHWQLNRSAAAAMEACAHVITNTQDAVRLTFLAVGFERFSEESTISGDSVDLITTGINMMSGKVAEALMIMATSLQDIGATLPEWLPPTLCRFAKNEHPAIRALILRRLPYLQSKNPELGWEIFRIAMQDATGLWHSAERCLYYAYHNHFETVSPLLERIYCEGSKNDMETWGRISALAAFAGHIDFANLLGVECHDIVDTF